jgi:hypothetical protein
LTVAWLAENPFLGISRPGAFRACVMTGEAVTDVADGLTLEEALAWGRARCPLVMIRPAARQEYLSAGAEQPPWGPELQWPDGDHADVSPEPEGQDDASVIVTPMGRGASISKPCCENRNAVRSHEEFTSWVLPHPPWDNDQGSVD